MSAKNISQSSESILDFLEKNKTTYPNLVAYISPDPFEFDLLIQHYKQKFLNEGNPFEVIIFVGEENDSAEFINLILNPDLFSPKKLIIIKTGVEFFGKSLDSEKTTGMFHTFQSALTNVPDSIQILIQFQDKGDAKKITRFEKLLPGTASLIHSKTFYPNKFGEKLQLASKYVGLHLEAGAKEEFYYRITPHLGTYLSALQKLKLFFADKKEISKEELLEVLNLKAETNLFQMADAYMANQKKNFLNEFSKLGNSQSQALGFFSILLTKLDEVRKAKVLNRRYNNNIPEEVLYKKLNWETYASGRKYILRSHLNHSLGIFNEKQIGNTYDTIITLNQKFKSITGKDEWKNMFLREFLFLFDAME